MAESVMTSTAEVICGGAHKTPMSGVELKIAIIVVIGIVLAIGITAFVKHLINR